MANVFSSDEIVAFEDILQGFDDYLVMSRNVNVYRTDMQMMERTKHGVTTASLEQGGVIWRPVPYIAESIDGAAGTDISSSFKDITQLSVPATIGFNKTVPWIMNAIELRDALQSKRFGEAAKQKLASDVNVALLNVASAEGTLVVIRTGAPAGFEDVAECEAIMNEQGVMSHDRYIAYNTRDYNLLAKDLGGRGTLNKPKTLPAYEKAYVGQVAAFETYKLDYANTLAAEGSTTVTVNGADQDHTPLSSTSATAGKINVDNRTQQLIIAVSSGTVALGDCFTIANVFAVHHITKVSTGQLKTFRITSLLASSGASGTMEISPAIVANAGSSDAEAQYQNVDSVPANGAAMVFLNIVAAKINPFWQKEALEILPGRLAVPEDAGAAVIRGATDQGLELVLTKQYDINTMKLKYRLDILFGVVCLNPEMVGIELFRQT